MKLKIFDKNILVKYYFVFVTTIGWLITSYILYYTQYHIYGGTIKTPWLYVVIYIPVVGIAEFLHDEEKQEFKKTDKKMTKILNIILNIILVCFMLYILITTPYNAVAWNVVVIIAFVLVISLFKKLNHMLKDKKNVKERCLFVICIYILLFVEPFVFAFITDAYTVKDTQNFLLEQGYRNPVYVESVETVRQLNSLFEKNVNLEDETEMALEAYIFTTTKDEKEIATAVSVKSQRILADIEVKEGSSIQFFISYLSKYNK